MPVYQNIAVATVAAVALAGCGKDTECKSLTDQKSCEGSDQKCTWADNQCSDKVETCPDFTDESTCKKDTTCQWDGSSKKCSKIPTDKCADLKQDACGTTDDCSWDWPAGDDAKCVSDALFCSSIIDEVGCDVQTLICEWTKDAKDADSGTCGVAKTPKTCDALVTCEANTDKTKCGDDKSCKWTDPVAPATEGTCATVDTSKKLCELNGCDAEGTKCVEKKTDCSTVTGKDAEATCGKNDWCIWREDAADSSNSTCEETGANTYRCPLIKDIANCKLSVTCDWTLNGEGQSTCTAKKLNTQCSDVTKESDCTQTDSCKWTAPVALATTGTCAVDPAGINPARCGTIKDETLCNNETYSCKYNVTDNKCEIRNADAACPALSEGQCATADGCSYNTKSKACVTDADYCKQFIVNTDCDDTLVCKYGVDADTGAPVCAVATAAEVRQCSDITDMDACGTIASCQKVGTKCIDSDACTFLTAQETCTAHADSPQCHWKANAGHAASEAEDSAGVCESDATVCAAFSAQDTCEKTVVCAWDAATSACTAPGSDQRACDKTWTEAECDATFGKCKFFDNGECLTNTDEEL